MSAIGQIPIAPSVTAPIPLGAVTATSLASLTQPQQDSITRGTIVVTATQSFVYKGLGDKTSPANYVELVSSGYTTDTELSTHATFAFRTLFASTLVSSGPTDVRYFSTIDAVGAVNSLQLRSFSLPYDCNIVACSATLYNTSSAEKAAGGSVNFNLVTKSTDTSASANQTYELLVWTLPAMLGASMTSTHSTALSPSSNGVISIPAGTRLATQGVFTGLAGASFRGEVTLYIVKS